MIFQVHVNKDNSLENTHVDESNGENFSRIRALESLYTEEQTECGVCVLSVVVEM